MTTPITELCDQLDQLRAAATPGTWSVSEDAIGGTDIVTSDEVYVSDEMGAISKVDAALIVAAVNVLPQLTAALRAVEALAEEYGAEADAVMLSAQYTARELRTALATVAGS